MPDDVRLAARIWLPEDAEDDPVPAILEYLPYRKRDGTVERDHLTHPYFAGHGYAGVRVDMRGTGDSEGACLGEYLKQEQDDCLAVIQWLAEQPWCSGAVGMIGISWGGFNGLQVAARRPPALKAVITLCSTDDRYADDIHFMGGAVLTDKLGWGATAFGIAHTPPDPEVVGQRWREMWKERLDQNGLWLLDWFRHQRRDDFYAHGSVCENFEDIEVPVYAVGGWADGYSNAVFRLIEHLPGPRKGLIGPWAHKYPHFAKPGPRIGFLQECLRWWDAHLKGLDTGIMEEPRLRAWIQDPFDPSPHHGERPGRWVAEPDWTSPAPETMSLYLAPDGLRSAPDEGSAPVAVASPQTAGHTMQCWCAYGVVPDGPLDQNGELGLMTVLETEPLAEDLDLLGFPFLHAEVASDRPQANLAAVLSAVGPDGAASLISFGILNLTHRDGHAAPEPLTPGTPVQVSVQLNACGQRIARGQKLRLALATAYWPIIWPSPEPARLTLTPGAARLELPCRPTRPADAELRPFAPPEGAAPLETEVLESGSYERRRSVDYATGIETIEQLNDSGSVRHLHSSLVVRDINRERFSIHPEDPNSAIGTCHWTKSYARGEWKAVVEVTASVEALPEVWRVTAERIARDADGIVDARSWSEDIPRDLV